MERMNGGDWEQKKLVDELMKGRESARQLQFQLGQAANSHELQEYLIQTIMTTFANALSLLQYSNIEHSQQLQLMGTFADSPVSLNGSPDSDNSTQPFKDPEQFDMNKKRKTMPKWSEQVRVCTGNGLEGQLDDGFGWRKYGQKEILGAKFPRAYYRCTHKVHGCPATKQVQRSADDPAVFEVIYRGKHTCLPTTTVTTTPLVPTPTPTIPNPSDMTRSLLLNFRTGLKVETQDLDKLNKLSPPLFSFPAMESSGQASNGLSPSLTTHIAVSVSASTSPTFISPATSESTYLPISPSPNGQLGQGSMSELADIISGPTLGTSSGLVDLDFLQYTMQDSMDPNSVLFDNFFFQYRDQP